MQIAKVVTWYAFRKVAREVIEAKKLSSSFRVLFRAVIVEMTHLQWQQLVNPMNRERHTTGWVMNSANYLFVDILRVPVDTIV